MSRRRNKSNAAASPETAAPNSGIIGRIVLSEDRTSARSPYRDRKGEDNAMAAATNGTPNVYRNYRAGGGVQVKVNTNAEIATAHGTRYAATGTYYPVFHSKVVDGILFPRYFEAIRKNIPQVIPYGIFDVLVYFTVVQAMLNQYCSWAATFAMVSEHVGTLSDLAPAYREMFEYDSGAHPSDTEADLKVVKGALETFSFPDILVSDAAWYWTPHRADPQVDAPVLIRETGEASQSFTSSLMKVGTSTSGVNNARSQASLNSLKTLVYNALQSETLTKISADLSRTGMLSGMSIPEFPAEPPFDLEWLDLWCNEGCLMSHSEISTKTVVPNGSNDANTERYQVPMKLVSPPSERFFRNLCFGFGQYPADMFRPDHVNANQVNIGLKDSEAWSTNATSTYVWHPADPTDGGSLNTWNYIEPAIQGNSAGIAQGILVKLAKAVEYYCRGNLGYKAVLAVDHVAAIDDEWEGMAPINPLGGRRYWFDAVRFEEAALTEYLRILGV